MVCNDESGLLIAANILSLSSEWGHREHENLFQLCKAIVLLLLSCVVALLLGTHDNDVIVTDLAGSDWLSINNQAAPTTSTQTSIILHMTTSDHDSMNRSLIMHIIPPLVLSTTGVMARELVLLKHLSSMTTLCASVGYNVDQT